MSDLIMLSGFDIKARFVAHELKQLVYAIDKDVIDLVYEHYDSGEEYVTIVYSTSAGVYKKRVCVTADSLRSLTFDVIKKV